MIVLERVKSMPIQLLILGCHGKQLDLVATNPDLLKMQLGLTITVSLQATTSADNKDRQQGKGSDSNGLVN